MPKKILIVEDEANIRELLRLYLEREGYTVLEAENGVEGIKKWKSDKPDMLLLDVMMPGMNGFDVCRRMREEGRRIPIVFLSAKGDIVDKSIGFKAGGDDYEDADEEWIVYTAPGDLMAVVKELEAQGIQVKGAEMTMIANTPSAVSVADAKKVMRLIDKLEELEDLQAVYHTMDITDEIAEALDE